MTLLTNRTQVATNNLPKPPIYTINTQIDLHQPLFLVNLEPQQPLHLKLLLGPGLAFPGLLSFCRCQYSLAVVEGLRESSY